MLHLKCAHETILPYDKVAIQHSFNISLIYQQKRSELNLNRALGGQLIKISYFAEGYKRADWKQQGSADGIGKGGSCLLCLRK
jgi:hypothetical protein